MHIYVNTYIFVRNITPSDHHVSSCIKSIAHCLCRALTPMLSLAVPLSYFPEMYGIVFKTSYFLEMYGIIVPQDTGYVSCWALMGQWLASIHCLHRTSSRHALSPLSVVISVHHRSIHFYVQFYLDCLVMIFATQVVRSYTIRYGVRTTCPHRWTHHHFVFI